MRSIREVIDRKIIWSLDDLCQATRENFVGLTNGCFGLFPHLGHYEYLLWGAQQTYEHAIAVGQGPVFVVCMNSNESIGHIKHYTPMYTTEERAFMLASLGFIDYVHPFAADDVRVILQQIQSGFYFKGGDRSLDGSVADTTAMDQRERAVLEGCGSVIDFAPFVERHSTAELVRYAREIRLPGEE